VGESSQQMDAVKGFLVNRTIIVTIIIIKLKGVVERE